MCIVGVKFGYGLDRDGRLYSVNGVPEGLRLFYRFLGPDIEKVFLFIRSGNLINSLPSNIHIK